MTARTIRHPEDCGGRCRICQQIGKIARRIWQEATDEQRAEFKDMYDKVSTAASTSEKQLHFHRTARHCGPALSSILRDILIVEFPALTNKQLVFSRMPGLDTTHSFLKGLKAAGVPDVDILLGIIEQDGEVAISLQ